MANKKNKRLSSSSSGASSNKQTDTIERTPENDYGVLSDPDEANELNQATSLATSPAMEEAEEAAERPAMPEQILAIIHEMPDTQPQPPPYTQLIEPQTPPSTIPEPLHQTPQIAPHPEPMTATSSMDKLKLILSSDKKYEEKMTLHTFFSFVVMAMSITSGVPETETLVEYLINHHSVNEYTKAYLHSLFETNVVKNIIQSILQFNNEHPDNFTKLVSAEKQQAAEESNPQIIRNDNNNNNNTPQPSRIRSFFKRLFCCCCARPRRRNSLPPPSPPPPSPPPPSDTSIVLKDTEMTPVVQEDATQE
jgi:hypothetical protein